ncbi:hypothetical protein J2T57_004216 [Natronocella acetinitrilica]|uniref:Uncharacterized protein n=1 Tax=Natronocella acetinitrilica TaxID=414046 RepID=A0AAE3G7T4_9GAMM|nr:hypothetical protein [Natronocella acetinitrilica]MCP1677042.1 hypothetical protein [Natronocella acetinitrilica]
MLGQIDRFEVTRVHGMNALWSLSDAYQAWIEYDKWKAKSDAESWDEKCKTADSTGTRVWALESAIFSKLTQTIVLYQASMEAILSNAFASSGTVADAVDGNGFKRDWEAALHAVGESTQEFMKYESDFYKEMRIPLTHLHPNSDDKLNKIRTIDFRRVYTGVRYGWWAHIRLLRGSGLGTGELCANWEYICSGVRLPPDLYPESYP